MITVEYLPGTFNVKADHQLRSVTDSSEWKVNPLILKKIRKTFWTPDIDLFASRMSHEALAYLAWKPDQFSGLKWTDVFQISWRDPSFPILSHSRSFKENLSGNATITLIPPSWQAQTWYPKTLQISIHNPVLMPKGNNLLIGPNFQWHRQLETRTLQLVTWVVSRKNFLQKDYLKKQSVLGTIKYYESSWRKRGSLLIPFNVIWIQF